MPYAIRKGGGDCPFEVYKKTGTGDEGPRVPGGCHPDNDAALGHQRALTAREKGAPPAEGLSTADEMDAALGLGLFDTEIEAAKTTMAAVLEADDHEGQLVPQEGEHFHAVAHRQGKSTGRRTFTNLAWRAPPFAYHWQKGSSAHGGTPLTVAIGLVTRMVDVGDDLHAFGALDLEGADGREYGRRLVGGWERWVSIGLDEQPYTTEEVWPEGEADDEMPGEMRRLFGEMPEQTLIDGGTIGELTGTSIPAQADAEVEPTPELARALAGEIPTDDHTEEAAFPPGKKANPFKAGGGKKTDDDCPDGQHMVDGKCVPITEEEEETASIALGNGSQGLVVTFTDGQVTVHRPDAYDIAAPIPDTKGREKGAKEGWAMDDGSFPIRDCEDVGKAVHAMNRPTNKSNSAIKAHITKRAKALGCSLPEAWSAELEDETIADLVESLTAAAYSITVPDLPPASWFDEPADVEIPGAFCITDAGRIYGILAPLHTGHRAYAAAGRRLTVPHGNVDLSRWMGGEALVRGRDGKPTRLAGVGPITMDCGHASRFRSDHEVAPAHYENSCAVFAKARAGETPEGLTWVAGALEPGVSPVQLSRALACRMSGDWQPHPDRPGWDELVAALLVPAPAFASGRTGPTLTHRQGALVASSMPVRHVAHPVELSAEERAARFESAMVDGGSDEWAVRARRINERVSQ